jgi:uncharacterized membrane protein
MNKTKKILIIIAIIFNFLGIAYQIYNIVKYFMLEPAVRPALFYCIFYFIDIFAMLTVAILLIMAISKNGKRFRERYGYYMSALVISIIINLFSVSTILLIITMFISDWEWITPKKEKTENNGNVIIIQPENKEKKIARLREKHEKGEISDEEFENELMKLL